MRLLWIAVIVLIASVWNQVAYGQDVRFLRGDSNDDGIMDISDAVTTLLYLFIDDAFDLDRSLRNLERVFAQLDELDSCR